MQAIPHHAQMTTFYQQCLSKMLLEEEDFHNEDYGQKVFLRKAVCKSQVKYSQKQKVLSRSAFSSSMAWILHGLTLTGCSWHKDVPADVSEPWLPCFGRWVRHKSLPRMYKGGIFVFPLSSCLCIHRIPPGMELTTMPSRPRAALMKALRPVRPEHFGSRQPVASTHPSFWGNAPVMSFLSPQPNYKHFWHEYDTNLLKSGLLNVI